MTFSRRHTAVAIFASALVSDYFALF